MSILRDIWNRLGEVDCPEEVDLSIDSSNQIEAELAKSSEDIERRYSEHFSSNKGKSKFRVEESQLNKEVKDNKEKSTRREEKEDVREI